MDTADRDDVPDEEDPDDEEPVDDEAFGPLPPEEDPLPAPLLDEAELAELGAELADDDPPLPPPPPLDDNSKKQLYVADRIDRIGLFSSTSFSTTRYESSMSELDGPVYT